MLYNANINRISTQRENAIEMKKLEAVTFLFYTDTSFYVFFLQNTIEKHKSYQDDTRLKNSQLESEISTLKKVSF